MQNLINSFFDTNQNKILYILKALPLSVIPAVFIAIILHHLNPSPINVGDELPLISAIIQLVLIAPLVETLIMWPLIVLITKFTKGNLVLTALVSALLWAAFHGLFNLNWGLTILWPFFVFSITFCIWRKESVWWALFITFCVHALQNLIAVLYMKFA